MEKEFIPYAEALALKELGFDEPCFGVYLIQSKEFVLVGSTERIRPKSKNCNAPTFSQAFRWFREKYNLKGYVSPVEYLDGTADTYHWCVYDKCNSGNDQLTHEEAELECLKKLIEIVKEKK